MRSDRGSSDGVVHVTKTQLEAALKDLRVTPPDVQRSVLYLAQLRQASEFLTKTLPIALNDNDNFIWRALVARNLLNELAAALDPFVMAALNNEGNPTNPGGHAYASIDDFFTQAIFDATGDVDTLPGKLAAFFGTYAIANAALTNATNNFQTNIQTACTRILADRALIEAAFPPDDGDFSLAYLQTIQTTGSDFHKGGTQVLLLTFAAWLPSGKAGTFRLVYKPSDLELDCRIAGDTDALRKVPGFETFAGSSLIEIVNGLIAAEKQAHPKSKLDPLPTYRILPRVRTSTTSQPNTYPIAVRSAYGYIEYLQHDNSASYGAYGFYLAGKSDYVLFRNQHQTPIVASFYRQLGQLVALAGIFGIEDMHGENVRVRGYRPYFIDLEVSLTNTIDDIVQTMLFDGEFGGVTGVTGPGSLVVKPFSPRLLERDRPRKRMENRLIALTPAEKLVGADPFSLIDGMETMVDLIAANRTAFDAWFAQISQGTLVRVLPYATADLRTLNDSIYLTQHYATRTLDAAVTELIGLQAADSLKAYARAATPPPPVFFAAQLPVMQPDFDQFDVPIFYRRVDATDMIDSRGARVPVGPSVTINGVQRAVDPPLTRTTYYAEPMTAKIQAAVAKLDADAAAKKAKWRASIVTALKLPAPTPTKPGFAYEELKKDGD
jgi:hypothetical protein